MFAGFAHHGGASLITPSRQLQLILGLACRHVTLPHQPVPCLYIDNFFFFVTQTFWHWGPFAHMGFRKVYTCLPAGTCLDMRSSRCRPVGPRLEWLGRFEWLEWLGFFMMICKEGRVPLPHSTGRVEFWWWWWWWWITLESVSWPASVVAEAWWSWWRSGWGPSYAGLLRELMQAWGLWSKGRSWESGVTCLEFRMKCRNGLVVSWNVWVGVLQGM